MNRLILGMLIMGQTNITAVNSYYYQKAAEDIAKQEEIERQARIQALAKQMQEEDRQALIDLIKGSFHIIGATIYVSAYITYNTIKFPIMLAYDHKKVGRKLMNLHKGTITGLLGTTLLATLIAKKYLKVELIVE